MMHALDFARTSAKRFSFLRRPASSASRGFVISTCSKPSVTRMATFFPSSFPCHKISLLLMLIRSSEIDSNKTTKRRRALDVAREVLAIRLIFRSQIYRFTSRRNPWCLLNFAKRNMHPKVVSMTAVISQLRKDLRPKAGWGVPMAWLTLCIVPELDLAGHQGGVARSAASFLRRDTFC